MVRILVVFVLAIFVFAGVGYHDWAEEQKYQSFKEHFFSKTTNYIGNFSEEELPMNVIGGKQLNIIQSFNEILVPGIIESVVSSEEIRNIVIISDYFPSTVYSMKDVDYFKYSSAIYKVPLSVLKDPKNSNCFSLVSLNDKAQFVGSLLLLKPNLLKAQLQVCLLKHYLNLNGINIHRDDALTNKLEINRQNISVNKQTRKFLLVLRENKRELNNCEVDFNDEDESCIRKMYEFYNAK